MLPRTLVLTTALVASGAAVAGVRIDTVSRDIKTQKADGPTQTVLVQGGAVRLSSGDGTTMILKDKTIYSLNAKQKTYREIDKATLESYSKQANSALTKMQEQLKDMPPEQRAQVEKKMGGGMPGAAGSKEDVYDAKDTGKTDAVDGRPCKLWNMLKNGVVYEEVCVVPFSVLPGKEDLQATFKEMAEMFGGLASSVPSAAKELKARNRVNGYPVRVRPIVNGAPTGRETVLKSWTEESVPASQFAVPSDYKKQEVPKYNAGGG